MCSVVIGVLSRKISAIIVIKPSWSCLRHFGIKNMIEIIVRSEILGHSVNAKHDAVQYEYQVASCSSAKLPINLFKNALKLIKI